MARETEDCLDRRLADIHAMIGGEALFQASATITGGRHCSATHGCGQWHDCAWAHDALLHRVTSLLTKPEEPA
ncbi:MAG: hypothetical protein EPN20_06085 [Magnetospirillum sp.]|nr:MAG: hypothetical protein EPN20_06085 [Magnetospirillum sp.]